MQAGKPRQAFVPDARRHICEFTNVKTVEEHPGTTYWRSCLTSSATIVIHPDSE